MRIAAATVFCTMAVALASSALGQETTPGPGAGVAVDSLHIVADSRDSLLRLDSIIRQRVIENQRRLDNGKQIATQRELDLTNDGKPEILRLSGTLAKIIDST